MTNTVYKVAMLNIKTLNSHESTILNRHFIPDYGKIGV